MPNATAHKMGAAVSVGTAVATYQYQANGEIDWKPLAAAFLAGKLGTLPDAIEPAFHPNHRQFFHSFFFLGLVGYGMYRLYKWETDDDLKKLLKGLGLIVGGAYATHLLMDSASPKSLPLI